MNRGTSAVVRNKIQRFLPRRVFIDLKQYEEKNQIQKMKYIRCLFRHKTCVDYDNPIYKTHKIDGCEAHSTEFMRSLRERHILHKDNFEGDKKKTQ